MRMALVVILALVRVGAYELVSEIGRGGGGTVYRARGRDGADVAVKVLRGGSAPEGAARFVRERRLHERLGAEEGFVPLLDSHVSKGLSYLVMPFVAGGTLRRRIDGAARAPLAVETVLELGGALA